MRPSTNAQKYSCEKCGGEVLLYDTGSYKSVDRPCPDPWDTQDTYLVINKDKNVQQTLYHYLTQWSEEDQAFIGRCFEFPSLAAHGSSHDEAKAEIVAAVVLAIADMEENGEAVPDPSTLSDDEIRAELDKRFAEISS